MTPDDQVDCIIRMMLRAEWRGGPSRKALAAEWGVHERTVGDRAIIASGFLARTGKELEAEALEALAELDTIKALALANMKSLVTKDGEVIEVPDPKLREATEAIKLKMDIRGITSKSRGRNLPKDEPVDDEYAKLSRVERIEKLKAALAEEEAARIGEMQ